MSSRFNAELVQGVASELNNLLLSFTEAVTIDEALDQITKTSQPNSFKLIQAIQAIKAKTSALQFVDDSTKQSSVIVQKAIQSQPVQPQCAEWQRSKEHWQRIFSHLQYGDIDTASQLELHGRPFNGNHILLLNALIEAGKTEKDLENLICNDLSKRGLMNC